MQKKISRRKFVASSTMLAAPFVLPFSAGPAHAQDNNPSWATVIPGVSLMLDIYVRHHKLDERNGFTLTTGAEYTSVPTYYNDFDVGAYDVAYGSWDTFAVRHLAGVPCKLLCLISTGEGIGFAARKGSDVKTFDDLRGRAVSAPQSTGTYRLLRALIKESRGWDLQEEANIQNVTNATASVNLLRSGVTEAALGWEPNLSDVLHQAGDLHRIGSVREEYTKLIGQELPYMGIGIRTERLDADPDIGKKLTEMMRMCIEGMVDNPTETAELVGGRSGFSPEVVYDVISSGKLGLKYRSLEEDSARDMLKAAAKFFHRNELLTAELPEEYFFRT